MVERAPDAAPALVEHVGVDHLGLRPLFLAFREGEVAAGARAHREHRPFRYAAADDDAVFHGVSPVSALSASRNESACVSH